LAEDFVDGIDELLEIIGASDGEEVSKYFGLIVRSIRFVPLGD
jgi:hypothetical protein